MPYHEWGDKDFDWDALGQAEQYIYTMVKRTTGCLLISKEKYGTIRYEWVFPPSGISLKGFKYHGGGPSIKLPFPLFYKKCKYEDNKYPVYLWSWDMSWLNRQWRSLGTQAVLYFAHRAAKKWPQVADEILDDLEWLM